MENLFNGAEMPAPVFEDRTGPYFTLFRGRSYCQAHEGHCSICVAGESHDLDDLAEYGCGSLEFVAANGVVWAGRLSHSNKSDSFGWWNEEYVFRPTNTPAQQRAKFRRRIEDALRKTATSDQLAQIATLLGVKTE